MNLRLLTFAIACAAAYLAFGEYLTAAVLSTPEHFIADIGRGIGGAVSGVAATVSNLLWG